MKRQLQALTQNHDEILNSEILDTKTVLEHQIKMLLLEIGEGLGDWEIVIVLHRQLAECLKLHKELTELEKKATAATAAQSNQGSSKNELHDEWEFWKQVTSGVRQYTP